MVVVKNVAKRNRKEVRYNMKKIILEKLKIVGICIILFSLIFSSIISHDELHVETCHDDDCALCQIIILSQSITKVTFLIIVTSFFSFIIFFILSRTHIVEDFYFQNSLISQKVQFNN